VCSKQHTKGQGIALDTCFRTCSLSPLCTHNPNLALNRNNLHQTTVINQFLSRFSTETMATKTITFSSLTTPQIFQVRGG